MKTASLRLVLVLALMCSASASQDQWIQRVVSGPSPRWGHAMVYDAARGVTVLFGGKVVASGDNDETWEWNGTAWTQRLVSGPSARVQPAMAYDTTRGVTVLFGGGAGDDDNDETWEWDGAAWTQRVVSGPSPRFYSAMAYDEARGVTVRFAEGAQTATPPSTARRGNGMETPGSASASSRGHPGATTTRWRTTRPAK